MSNVVKVVKKGLNNNEIDLDKYLREKHKKEEQEKIKYFLELLRENTNISEDMVRQDLRKYFRIAKREYYKEQLRQSNSNNKGR